ncbi:endospore germination permease [Rossellomorea sp. GCM10028870]|uniref:GerAB/ArcD/ProY family transporter n=1 Tax=Rossellomorea sp. GCM10028870 TaxID=3273426 RepID=UPI00360F7402
MGVREGCHITTYKINSIQLFVLIFLFELGSSIIVGLGFDANQDAWLVILLAMIGGIILFLLYEYLFKQYPNLPLTEYVEKIVGKYPGKVIAFMYILYFFYIAGRVLRDFGDLLITTTLSQTPLMVINLLMVLLVVYAYYLGIEVIARTGNIFFIILTILASLFFIFVFIDRLPQLEHLQPVLEQGWIPVLKTAFPLTLTFPFGEIIVFTMIFPFLNRKEKVLKTGLFAVIFSGTVLIVTMSVILGVLGPTIGKNTEFPLMEAIEKVNIAQIIQRLDPIALGIFIIGVYFKITLFFFAGMYGFERLFRIKKQKFFLLLTGTALLSSSVFMAEGFTQHLQIGLKVVPLYVHMPFQVYIPLLLFLILVVKRAYKQWSRSLQ